MTADDPLFAPMRLKHLTLRNRIMSTSHASGMGNADHMPAEAYQAYHVEKARGGLALTMFGGSSYVASDSTWATGQLDISSDRIVPHLARFSEQVHDAGAALMIQITHLGRRAETNTQNWRAALAPSRVREIGHRAIPRAMDRADIDRIVTEFGAAARRAKEGGLDGLEVMTHGHLVGQFFSPVTNHRSDAFGGSLENRCRFGLMVFAEIRRQVGDDFIIGMRLGIDDSAIGGSDLRESVAIVKMFEAEGLLDFVNASSGRIDTELALATECMPGMSVPSAPWLSQVGAFKREIAVPVFHAAKINDVATARHAIAEGLLDMVAMTRAHIADPHLVAKLARGEDHRIRPCVGASHCMGVNRPTCVHNPATGRERTMPQVITPTDGPTRRVVVVGGGIAGLEAARIAGARGHDVVLLEAAEALGGQVRLAGGTGWRKDIRSLVDWRIGELEALGVEVRLNVLAEPETVMDLGADVVILATGGSPALPLVAGADLCTDPWDVLAGAARPSGRVLIHDGTGRHVAPLVAERVQGQGAQITYLSVDDVLAKELAYGERVVWRKRFAELGVAVTTDQTLVEVRPLGNALEVLARHELTGDIARFQVDTVIADDGVVADDTLFDGLAPMARNGGRIDPEAFGAGAPQPDLEGEGFVLFRIGDAVASRDIAAATFDALRLCARL